MPDLTRTDVEAVLREHGVSSARVALTSDRWGKPTVAKIVARNGNLQIVQLTTGPGISRETRLGQLREACRG